MVYTQPSSPGRLRVRTALSEPHEGLRDLAQEEQHRGGAQPQQRKASPALARAPGTGAAVRVRRMMWCAHVNVHCCSSPSSEPGHSPGARRRRMSPRWRSRSESGCVRGPKCHERVSSHEVAQRGLRAGPASRGSGRPEHAVRMPAYEVTRDRDAFVFGEERVAARRLTADLHAERGTGTDVPHPVESGPQPEDDDLTGGRVVAHHHCRHRMRLPGLASDVDQQHEGSAEHPPPPMAVQDQGQPEHCECQATWSTPQPQKGPRVLARRCVDGLDPSDLHPRVGSPGATSHARPLRAARARGIGPGGAV